jgi:tRNA(Ile)-lysidine synthase
MPSRRVFAPSGAGRDFSGVVILRPLLALSRADVESYLSARGISWACDTTNSDEKYLRNRIRHTLIPLLNKEFPGWRGGLEALGDTQSLAADFINTEARRRIPWEPAPPGGKGRRCGAEVFFKEPLIIREEALFQGLGIFGLPRTASVKRRNLRRFARGELRDLDLGFCRIALTGGEGGKYISIFRGKGGGEAGFSLLIKEPGLYKLKSGTGGGAFIRVLEKGKPLPLPGPFSGSGQRGGFFAALPLVLRFAQAGDMIRLRGGKGLGFKNVVSAGNRSSLVPYNAGGTGALPDALTALDPAGTAAFIGLGPTGAVILRQREFPPRGELFFCEIGGIDV